MAGYNNKGSGNRFARGDKGRYGGRDSYAGRGGRMNGSGRAFGEQRSFGRRDESSRYEGARRSFGSYERSTRPERMPEPRFGRDQRPVRMSSPQFGKSSRPVRMPEPRFGRSARPDTRMERRPEAMRPERPRFERAPVYDMPEKQEPAENILAGRNPIREAINAGRPIERLLVARGLTGSAVEIIARARQAGIVVQEVDRKRLDAVYPNHQGMVAYASAGEYAELADLLKIPEERGEEPFFVALDGVTDPHNLGAILRSAAAAGAHGVIVPERRAAGLVPAAVKASAGALEHIAVAKVGNLRQALDTLKEHGIWLVAAASDGENVYGTDLTGSICLVIGSEGDGIGPLVRSTCDRVVSLPMENGMESLNASVAAGILLYEIRRARGAM